MLVVLCSNSPDVPLFVATCNGGDHAHETSQPRFNLDRYIATKTWIWRTRSNPDRLRGGGTGQPKRTAAAATVDVRADASAGWPPGLSTMAAFHVFGGPGQEPSTIGNFKGSSGIAFIGGNVTRTNIKTGEQQSFPFTDADMRFMTGTFISVDGKEHQGTFGFV